MKDQRQFINANKQAADKSGRVGKLFLQKVVSGHSERLYGYVVFGRKERRSYIGLRSKHITGYFCRCGRRTRRPIDCYQCRQVRRTIEKTVAKVAGVQ